MTAISLINITLELAGSLVCLSFIFFSLIGRSILKKSGIYMVTLLSVDTLLLVFDAMAYIFRGNTTESGFFMTKTSNFLVYILQFGLLAIQKEKLTEQRIRLITSQIQPHFLYNALATISCLCQIDPGMAERAVDHFADYLRMNLDTLNNDRLIEFNKELEHTKTYLWLEQLRFGSDLRIEYDIRFTDFDLPPLVLQPLAENAVKHGICKREDGGTVHISCCRVDGHVEITVCDDGVGFEVGRSFTDERSHVGISNVRERLEKLCGGTLRVTSDPGHGTCAIITIPGGFIHEDPVG